MHLMYYSSEASTKETRPPAAEASSTMSSTAFDSQKRPTVKQESDSEVNSTLHVLYFSSGHALESNCTSTKSILRNLLQNTCRNRNVKKV